jgi:hypothetical protein
MNSAGIYLGIFIVLVIALILSFRLALFMARRSICKVITIFRENRAVDYQKAQPLEALGLGPLPFFHFRLLRDYKPWALQTLVQAGIVRTAEQGTFYLSEETLEANEIISTACRIK